MTLAQRVEELTISGGGDSKRAIGEFATETTILYILNVLFSAYFARNF